MPPPPRAVLSSVSPGLDAVILKALDKDPELRYQSARELLVDLERLAPGASASTSAGTETTGRWRRLLGRSLVVAAVLALVALGVRELLPAGTPRVRQVRRITGGLGRPADIGWVTDGVRLYYVGAKAGGMALYQVAAGGEPAEIPLPFANVSLLAYVEKEAALLMAASDTWAPVGTCRGTRCGSCPCPRARRGGSGTSSAGRPPCPATARDSRWARRAG